ncbi:MAG: hypothetical protein Q9166_003182 [cf. Caloplaca sp. 2 TL-2023]
MANFDASWTPGASLGAYNASSIYNPASTSHVRVTVKGDNLGLGASNGAMDDDRPTTGLDGLQDLLGRLNGKDSQLLQSSQRSRADGRRITYAERRWGFDKFVSGGFLVGNRIQQTERAASNLLSITEPRPKVGDDKDISGVRTGKRKRGRMRDPNDSGSPRTVSSKNQPSEHSLQKTAEDTSKSDEMDAPHITNQNAQEKQRRIEKMERKAQRRARKAEHSAVRALEESKQRPAETFVSDAELSKEESAITTQVLGTTSALRRHAVRLHSIKQKRMSSIDQKALNEILMIRA